MEKGLLVSSVILLNAIAMATRCVLPPVKLRKWIENECEAQSVNQW
jgi:hypothetical protein